MIFHEITEHLTKDSKPSEYVNHLSEEPIFKENPFPMLNQLKLTEQSKIHHPEGSVWNHTMLVIDEAAKVRENTKNKIAFMWAALLHDIGKPDTTRIRNGRITSYDHDIVGATLCKQFLSALTDDDRLMEEVSALVRYHMHILYVLKKLPYGNIKGLQNEVDKNDIALLCLCDRCGRLGVNKEEEEKEYRKFLRFLENKEADK